jgi:hypothetical protein
MGKRVLVLGGWLATLVAAPAVHAAPQWRLLYVRDAGAEGCPDEMEVRMAVAARLGHDPFSSGASAAVVARIGTEGAKLAGSVEVIDESGRSRGKRELLASAATCDEMATAMALSISIAVDPERATSLEADEERHRPRAVSPPEPAPIPVESPPHAAVARDVTPPVRERHAVVMSGDAAAVSIWGVAPALAWGATARWRLRWAWLVVAGGLSGAASPNATVRAGASLRTKLAALELEACAAPGPLQLCAVTLAGMSSVAASGVLEPRTDVGLLAALGAQAGVAAPVSRRLDLFGEAALFRMLSPVRATIDGVEVWQAPALAASVSAGARLHFP